MPNKPPFSGDGFSRDDLSPEDLASHREAHRELSDAWPVILGLKQMANGAGALRKVVVVAAILGGAAAFLVQQGVL